MKKLVLALNVFFLSCALCISTVMAAPSPTSGVGTAGTFSDSAVVVTSEGKVVSLDAVKVLVTMIEANEEAIAEMYPELSGAKLEAVVAMLDKDDAEEIIENIMDMADVEFDVSEMMNLDLVADENFVTLEDGSVQVTFDRPNVSEGDHYQVIHFNEETGLWEKVDTVVTNGEITATFTSFSPVAIVTWSDEVDTGDNTSYLPYGIAAVAAVAVIVLVAKKSTSKKA